jgi:hypothetical protein
MTQVAYRQSILESPFDCKKMKKPCCKRLAGNFLLGN